MECASGIISPCPSTLAGPASHLFLTLINTLIGSQCMFGPEGRFPPDHGPLLNDGDEFDFIVVGSGSAGAVVANRLSQVEDWKILLLEAGTYPSPMSEIPPLCFGFLNTPEDWNYVMEPSKTCCLGLRGSSCPIPRGKAVGGSSVINAMLYVRGNRIDFDSWEAAGNVGWGYDSVVRNFENFEHAPEQDNTYLGKNGELAISRYTNPHPIREILEEAYREVGYTTYQEHKPIGFLDTYTTISQGTRSSAAKAFIETAKDRKNLFVTVNAHVSKLSMDKERKIVDGVEVIINNKLFKLKAKKEVILSAGSISSPQILMNSGIGPKEHLESLGIQVVKNLNVGQNLQDHVVLPMFININEPVLKPRMPTDTIDDLYQYFMHRQGPLSTIDLLNFISFINTKKDSQFPNFQFVHGAYYANDTLILQDLLHVFGVTKEVIATIAEYNKNSNTLFFSPILLKPRSAGKILLRNADPFEKPLIFPNYLSDDGDKDLQEVLEAVKFVELLTQTSALKKYQPEIADLNLPNCKQFTFNTDEYWKCAIRNIAGNLFHPVGTCKMGPVEDPTAVVDARLRVHGIHGLRVVDGSVMPSITSGNTNSPIMMIGDKGAEFIKEDWLKKHKEL